MKNSWLARGNLNNGSGNAGLSALNGNNALSNSNWNYAGRNSGYKIFFISLHGGCGKEQQAAEAVPGRKIKLMNKPPGW